MSPLRRITQAQRDRLASALGDGYQVELGYKHATRKNGTITDGATTFDVGGRTTNWSAMVNGLVDFGGNDGINFSVGAGVGYAHTKSRFSVDATVATGDGNYYFDNFSSSISQGE